MSVFFRYDNTSGKHMINEALGVTVLGYVKNKKEVAHMQQEKLTRLPGTQ